MNGDWPVKEVAAGGDLCDEGPTWSAAGKLLLWVDNERSLIFARREAGTADV